MLAVNDDPDLPLITCSSDGDTAYLLDKSLLSNAALESAKQRADYRVGLTFDEIIRTGQAMITGQSTAEQARGLASTLANGPLH